MDFIANEQDRFGLKLNKDINGKNAFKKRKTRKKNSEWCALQLKLLAVNSFLNFNSITENNE